ncbi:MAG: hypothetical protein OXC27_09115, partial [Caldilineaceae bacterium]|nr:hypothetical protein [Caldilineaceae bacterium]
SDRKYMRRGFRELPVQYLLDEQGNVQSVLVPIDLWSRLIALYEAANTSANIHQASYAATPTLTMFGAFPELAEIEFGEQFEAVKQLGRLSIEKQLGQIENHPFNATYY